MSSRTQMRLQQLTGSLSSAQAATAALSVDSLQGVLDHVASGIKRVHGGDAFHSQAAGVFNHTLAQFTGSVGISVNVDVDGEARLASAKVEDLTSGRIVFASAGGELVDNSALAFDGTDLIVGSAKVSDLTNGRVVYAGASGALVDSAEMTFGAGGLTLAKDLSARSGSFSGDVTVSGNLNVMGATTTIDTQNLLVKDAKIVISSGSLVDGAGIYLGDDNAGENIRWATADGGKWIASDKFAADEIQALDLSSALVYADASGNLKEVTDQQLADAIEGRLVAGTGVSISEAGAAITIAIGQPVATTDAVTFAVVTGSNLTASRLMASNGSKAMVSADLYAWVAGTANQVIVADDADGSITLSLPQSIHTDADVEFDSLKLGDNVADAGKALKIGALGTVVAAAWDEFVAVEADVGLELVQSGFKAQIGLAQDIRTSASPEFLALNLAAYGDLVADGSNFKIAAAAELLLSGADGQYQFAESGDRSSFTTLFGASETVIGAINTLKTSGNLTNKYVNRIASVVASGTDVTFTGFNYSFVPPAERALRIDVYVNGQLLLLDGGAGKEGDYELGTGNSQIKFKFELAADDVATVIVR